MNESLRAMESGGEEALRGHETGWEELGEMEFSGAEADRGRSEMAEEAHEEGSREQTKTEHLAVLREQMTGPKPVDELTPEAATKEYLDLLMDLSANFTSDEGRESRVAARDKDGKLVIMNRGYSGDFQFAKGMLERAGMEFTEGTSGSFQEGDFHYDDKYLDRAHTLKMVDGILGSEEAWRGAGEAFEEANTEAIDAEAALAKFQEEDGKKGVLKKLFTFGKRRKERKQLEARVEQAQAAKHKAEMLSVQANRSLEQGLNSAYSEDYGYGSHELSYEHRRDEKYKDEINRKYNEEFFGADDPERQAKIERALELRKKVMAKK